MEVWASAEVHQPADHALERVRRCVISRLNGYLSRSSLAELQLKLRYVPIVMPPHMHKRYPERSKSLINKRIYDCAPRLDYETFVSGNFDRQVTEYMRGVASALPHLSMFGVTLEQLNELSEILNNTAVDALVECPPTLHNSGDTN